MRTSKLGGKILIVTEFDHETNSVCFSMQVRRGRNLYNLNLENGKVPDSIIIDEVWYNLYINYQEVQELLNRIGITNIGNITLGEYIKIRQLAIEYPDIEIVDHAADALINHPGEETEYISSSFLKANLYPYQRQGYLWMRFIISSHFGCILGDEMGLGKTLQIIALIAMEKQEDKGPSLIIAPVSLLENWRREFAKFTEGIDLLIHHGPERTGFYSDLQKYDAVIISYNTAVSDLALLKMIKWNLVIADEAQNIKNPGAIRTKSIKNIPRNTAIAVTGTPFENHVTDLWSIMDFIAPGCFGTLKNFENEYSDDLYGARKLEPYLTPLMIRRRVRDVADDLPERIDIPQILAMTETEVSDYEAKRKAILESFDGKNATLPMLQKLRMFCTYPGLEDGVPLGDPEVCSAKYTRLIELLEEIISLNEKVLLFTSFNGMVDILCRDIGSRFGIPVIAINGSTPSSDRQSIIDSYSNTEGSALLILNPRAAGTGLNITAASRVIHYNPEWNPALEDQASARAWRRGQDKTVFVYRLIYKGTVEEIINERIEKKRNMFQTAVIGTDGSDENSKDIIRALMISPEGRKL